MEVVENYCHEEKQDYQMIFTFVELHSHYLIIPLVMHYHKVPPSLHGEFN